MSLGCITASADNPPPAGSNAAMRYLPTAPLFQPRAQNDKGIQSGAPKIEVQLLSIVVALSSHVKRVNTGLVHPPGPVVMLCCANDGYTQRFLASASSPSTSISHPPVSPFLTVQLAAGLHFIQHYGLAGEL